MWLTQTGMRPSTPSASGYPVRPPKEEGKWSEETARAEKPPKRLVKRPPVPYKYTIETPVAMGKAA